MKEISIDQLNSFHDWAMVLTSNESAFIKDMNIKIDFYGEGDNSYLVFEFLSDDQKSANQFLFHGSNCGQRPLVALFDLLKTVEFSCDKLINIIRDLEFKPTDVGQTAIYKDFTINKVFLSAR